MREFETDDRVLDKGFTEGTAFMCIFDGFFVANAGETDALDYYPDPFVVEVRHDNCTRDIRVSL